MSAATAVRSPLTTAWRRIPGAWRQPLTVVGFVIAASWLVIALLAPWIAPYDPLAQGTDLYQAPSAAHLLGTDEIGRDVFSRLLWGAQISIPLAMLLVGLAFAIGGTLGGLAGYLGGWVDELVMRAADFVFAVPTILLAMAVVAALGPGLFHAVLAVVLVSWPGHARVVRGLVRTTMQSEYVAVGRLLGSPTHRALTVDVLPNVAGPVIVLAGLGVGVDGLRRSPALRGLVDRGVPGARHRDRRSGLQLPRRQPPRRLRPEGDHQGPRRMTALLSVRDLRVWLDTARGPLSIVDGVSFDIAAGQVFGLAGESGSGKTITALALLGLLPPGARAGGSAILDGRDLLAMGAGERRRVRGREVAMIFQDPMSSLHPMLTVERQLTEHLRYQLGMSRREAQRRAVELLTEVRIPDPQAALRAYPHQFSGGMRQRIQIAIGLACEPRLLIADEPTTALDVTVQAGILRLLDRLCREKDLAVILITHDLGVLSALADTVTVMYAGRVAESGPTAQVMGGARHPYTRGLIDSLPHPEAGDRALVPIAGDPAGPEARPGGCAFHPRCRFAEPSCRTSVPQLIRIDDGREMACPVDPLVASLSA